MGSGVRVGMLFPFCSMSESKLLCEDVSSIGQRGHLSSMAGVQNGYSLHDFMSYRANLKS